MQDLLHGVIHTVLAADRHQVGFTLGANLLNQHLLGITAQHCHLVDEVSLGNNANHLAIGIDHCETANAMRAHSLNGIMCRSLGGNAPIDVKVATLAVGRLFI
jgi:hypothetical protein